MLLGFDHYPGLRGRMHFFGPHTDELDSGHDFNAWRSKMQPLADDLKAAGVEVINCSRDTALTCFPRGDLLQCLSAC